MHEYLNDAVNFVKELQETCMKRKKNGGRGELLL